MAKLSTSQIISRITKDCNFSQGEENDGSRYLELGILTVRISNHCTHLWTWHNKYGERFPKSMVSLVFDGGESEPQPILKRPSNVKFTVMEYVYPSELSINDVMLIIKEINAYKQTYTDPLGIIQGPNPITSVNPTIDIEVGEWDNSLRKIIYSDNMFGGKYKNEIEAKAVIKNYCQSHPINNKMPIPVYSIIYNCPDKPRVIIASYVQLGNKEIQQNNMQSARIKPLYESKNYKNMKKNVQRINESQLRAIVAESVRRTLNELDWRTYANAAKKAREQGRDSAYDFNRKAEEELNNKYPGDSKWHIHPSDENVYQRFGKWDKKGNEEWGAWRPMQGHEDFGSHVDFGTKRKYDPSKGVIDCTPTDDEREVGDFVRGKSNYTQGKGWHLKGE